MCTDCVVFTPSLYCVCPSGWLSVCHFSLHLGTGTSCLSVCVLPLSLSILCLPVGRSVGLSSPSLYSLSQYICLSGCVLALSVYSLPVGLSVSVLPLFISVLSLPVCLSVSVLPLFISVLSLPVCLLVSALPFFVCVLFLPVSVYVCRSQSSLSLSLYSLSL